MDLDRRNLIVPVTATRRLQLAGGQPMEQAVPEDYVIAAMVLRALERCEGRTLEFILKSYLPVVIVPSPELNRYFLVEQLGLTSETIHEMKSPKLEKLQEQVEKAATSEELLKCLNSTRSEIKKILDAPSATIVGLFAGLAARGVGRLLDRPSSTSFEEFSVILTGMIRKSEFDKSIKTLQDTSVVLSTIEEELTELVDNIQSRIESLVGTQKERATPVLSRLDLRVESLIKQIEDIESEKLKISAGSSSDKSVKLKELDQLLDARKSALLRDQNRQSEVVSELADASQNLSIGCDELTAESKTAVSLIRNQHSALADMMIAVRLADEDTEKSVILIPFFIAGFSKKDQLQIEVYPLSHLQSNGERVSRRRDYVDMFESPSRSIDALSSLLEDRTNSDVALRKFIRDSSQDYNILANAIAREYVRSGAEALLGDALVKRPLIEELKDLLTAIPETKLRKQKRRLVTHVLTNDTLCNVKFHIHNEAGKPIDGAELELGVLSLKSDLSGVITTQLPQSHYDGIVRASGFIVKPVEFSLASTDDVVIPIVMIPLSHEEQIILRLDELVERARRLDMIRERLWVAFESQGSTLLGIPAYRNALMELLTELGYEPEAWIAEAKKKTGMVKRLLKRDDRIDGLRRDILRMAEESKQSGGIMLFSELLVRLDDLGWSTGSDEIETIITDMSKEGLINGLSPLESGALLVEFVPVALTNDPQLILDLAAQRDGQLTLEDAVIGLGWTEERVRKALNLLINNGVAKEQRSYSKSTQYFFPGLIGGKK
ncbi:hypothetical protein EU528_05765 [Candidatus Thorarchaeota archaeon]|nr:MAG: hypothetical protein EU528_05765 [Candidatus Thorarchaeota archaeon]